MAAVATDVDLEALFEADSMQPCRLRNEGVCCLLPAAHLLRGWCLCGPRSGPICDPHRLVVMDLDQIRCYRCRGWITHLWIDRLGS